MMKKLISIILILTFALQCTDAWALRTPASAKTDLRDKIIGAMHEGKNKARSYEQLTDNEVRLFKAIATALKGYLIASQDVHTMKTRPQIISQDVHDFIIALREYRQLHNLPNARHAIMNSSLPKAIKSLTKRLVDSRMEELIPVYFGEHDSSAIKMLLRRDFDEIFKDIYKQKADTPQLEAENKPAGHLSGAQINLFKQKIVKTGRFGIWRLQDILSALPEASESIHMRKVAETLWKQVEKEPYLLEANADGIVKNAKAMADVQLEKAEEDAMALVVDLIRKSRSRNSKGNNQIIGAMHEEAGKTQPAAAELEKNIDSYIQGIKGEFFAALKRHGLFDVQEKGCIIASGLLAKLISKRFGIPLGGDNDTRIEMISGYFNNNENNYHEWIGVYTGGKEPSLFIDSRYDIFDGRYEDSIIIENYKQALDKYRLKEVRTIAGAVLNKAMAAEGLKDINVLGELLNTGEIRDRLLKDAYNAFMESERTRRGNFDPLGDDLDKKSELAFADLAALTNSPVALKAKADKKLTGAMHETISAVLSPNEPIDKKKAKRLLESERAGLDSFLKELNLEMRDIKEADLALPSQFLFEDLPHREKAAIKSDAFIFDLGKIGSSQELLDLFWHMVEIRLLGHLAGVYERMLIMSSQPLESQEERKEYIEKIAYSFIANIGIKPQETVLDLATGETAAVALGAARYAKKVYAVDISDKVLEAAKKYAEDKGLHNIEFVLVNSSKLPFEDNAFDRVIVSRCFFDLPDQIKLRTLREIYRVLKPGGSINFREYRTAWSTKKWESVLTQFGFENIWLKVGTMEPRTEGFASIMFDLDKIYIVARKKGEAGAILPPKPLFLGAMHEEVKPAAAEGKLAVSADFTPGEGQELIVTIQPDVPNKQYVELKDKRPISWHPDIIKRKFGENAKIIGYMSNGNACCNKGHVVFSDGKLYMRADEPWQGKVYSMFCIFKDATREILDVELTPEGRVINTADGEDITEKLEQAFSGERIVRAWRAVDWRTDKDFKGYADPRHLFWFPYSLFDNRPAEVQAKTGKKDVFREILWNDEAKKERGRRGEKIELPLSMLARYGYSDKEFIRTELLKAGYETKDIDFTDEDLIIRLKPGIYQHHTIGLTKEGRVVTAALTGAKREVGGTFEELAELNLKNGVKDAILLDNGGDILINKSDAVVPSLTNRDTFTSMVFLVEKGQGGLKALGRRNKTQVNLSHRHKEFEALAKSKLVQKIEGLGVKVIGADLGLKIGAYHFKAITGEYIIVINIAKLIDDPKRLVVMRSEALYHEAREIYWELKGFKDNSHIVASAQEMQKFAKAGQLSPYHEYQLGIMSQAELDELISEGYAQRSGHRDVLATAKKIDGGIDLDAINTYENLLREKAKQKKLENASGVIRRSAAKAMVLATTGALQNLFNKLTINPKEDKTLVFSWSLFKEVGVAMPAIAANAKGRVAVVFSNESAKDERVRAEEGKIIDILNQSIPSGKKILKIRPEDETPLPELRNSYIRYLMMSNDEHNWVEDFAREVVTITEKIIQSIGKLYTGLDKEMEEFKEATKVLTGA